MEVRPVTREDYEEWLRMRHALWPGYPAQQIWDETAEFWTDGKIWHLPSAVFVLDRGQQGGAGGDGRLGGFVEASIRPAADGCLSSPVGYVEGWYVDEDLRGHGWGARLVEAAEAWVRAQGMVEMGSDCNAENRTSFGAHAALGYRQASRRERFHRTLVDVPVGPAHDWVGIVPDQLSAGMAVRLVTDPAAGGIDVFLGTTRAETNERGQELVRLDYEAYVEMAEGQMRDLVRRARERWPICRSVLLHRIGRVKVGEPSVVIAVSTPHRAEAFEACRWLIDGLKKDVAVWKKEVWSDGTGTWVHPTA